MLKDRSATIGGNHINLFTPKGMRSLLHRFGFAVLRITTPGKLNAELVRINLSKREFDLSNAPFLNHILIEQWEKY